MKYTRSADFCAGRIDVITNSTFITNAVIKRVHCIVKSRNRTSFIFLASNVFLETSYL